MVAVHDVHLHRYCKENKSRKKATFFSDVPVGLLVVMSKLRDCLPVFHKGFCAEIEAMCDGNYLHYLATIEEHT